MVDWKKTYFEPILTIKYKSINHKNLGIVLALIGTVLVLIGIYLMIQEYIYVTEHPCNWCGEDYIYMGGLLPLLYGFVFLMLSLLCLPKKVIITMFEQNMKLPVKWDPIFGTTLYRTLDYRSIDHISIDGKYISYHLKETGLHFFNRIPMKGIPTGQLSQLKKKLISVGVIVKGKEK